VLAAQGGGHILNAASIAGLIPGAGPIYDAAKHAVVAVSEGLYQAVNVAMLPVGSVTGGQFAREDHGNEADRQPDATTRRRPTIEVQAKANSRRTGSW
jgi:short-subunit dehydrogenase